MTRILLTLPLAMTACYEEDTFEGVPTPMCAISWAPVGADDATPLGFTAAEAAAWIEALPDSATLTWRHDDVEMPSDTLSLLLSASAAGAELGEAPDPAPGCPAWRIRLPVDAVARVDGLLAPSDVTGFADVEALDRTGVSMELDGTPVLDPERPDWMKDAVADDVGDAEVSWDLHVGQEAGEGRFRVSYAFVDETGGHEWALGDGVWEVGG